MKGLVIKSTGSGYHVQLEDGTVLDCRIKGKFRIKGIKTTNPIAVGDQVSVEIDEQSEARTGLIYELAERFFLNNNLNNFKLIKWNPYLDKKIGVSFTGYDKHISIGSLGQFLRNDKNSFQKAKFPYLIPSKDKRIYFKNNFKNNKKYNVGISWKTTNTSEIHRNIGLDKIKKILSSNNCNFYNLQFGDCRAEIDFFNKNKELLILLDIDYKNDFENVAALISELDFVITIQNTVAHLSCSLSKETWIILSTFPRFNWGFEKDKCSWYPSAVIFRQKIMSEWDYIILAIEKKIKALPRKF